jgi:acid phosphatase
MKLGRPNNPSAFLAPAITALLFAQTVFSVPGIANEVADKFPEELRQKIKYVIVIYPENRSFDSLYGNIRGVNGLKQATPESYVQVQPNGTPFATLPQPNTSGIPGITSGPDSRFPAVISNLPFSISPNAPITDRHGDLIHRFYTEQYQINDPSNPFSPGGVDPKSSGGAPMSKFAAFSDNAGLVMGHYDAQFDAEGQLAKQFSLCDNAFHSAFGGSFLNHMWLVAARTPIWPADPQDGGSPPNPSSATVFGADGFPVFNGTSVSDGALTNDPKLAGFSKSNTAKVLAPGDYWAVNTLRPLRGPAGGLNTISPIPPPPGPITQPINPTSNTAVAARLPLQTYDTIGDRLSDGKVSWAWYSGGWDDAKAGVANYLFQFHHQPFAFFAKYALAQTPVPATATTPAVPGVDSPGSAAHLKDIDHDFFRQLQDGTLPRVSFVKPIGQKNEHPGYASVNEGSDWIASTVQKIRDSKYWHECAIFVMYDEHGGLWDHVVPAAVDNWGPGLRVPLEVISPFAKRSFIDHTQYETVSLLKFIEGVYRLPALNTRDASALPPVSSFLGQPDLVIKATQGKPFEYQLPAYNDPFFFFVVGNLDGIQTDPFSGTISGIPKRSGDFSVLVFVAGKEKPVVFTAQLQVEKAD